MARTLQPLVVEAAVPSLADHRRRRHRDCGVGLETHFDGRLFERLSTGACLTPLGPVLAGFRERALGIALALRAAPFSEGLRLLVRGETDLHCGGANPGDTLPAFLRRERFPDIAAGISAADTCRRANRSLGHGSAATMPRSDRHPSDSTASGPFIPALPRRPECPSGSFRSCALREEHENAVSS